MSYCIGYVMDKGDFVLSKFWEYGVGEVDGYLLVYEFIIGWGKSIGY